MSFNILEKNIFLEKNGVMLTPLSLDHTEALAEICKKGEFGKINTISTPDFMKMNVYVENALQQKQQGIRYPFVVIDSNSKKIIGTTSYHDIIFAAKRLEIGYTWYAIEYQRTHVNTTCKYLLLNYAFEVLKANTVGFRTDVLNFKSQKAIERLGIHKDGIFRGNAIRKDGTIQDMFIYSVILREWQVLEKKIIYLLSKY
ncbi:GNAT family protein [Acinetobacter baumannii]|uniref:GNAT family N-acetyltransferase n=1 Tax=Acinetobacter baumannii TaxID=470 RepID=UPI002448413B|nr:GNAT family protein [Acinetobacter baumannii]MDH2566679.1 GNAT family protein [Acinetobacter baumannii]